MSVGNPTVLLADTTCTEIESYLNTKWWGEGALSVHKRKGGLWGGGEGGK